MTEASPSRISASQLVLEDTDADPTAPAYYRVSESNPLPVKVVEPARVAARMVYFPPFVIPGIGTGSAYQADDAFGVPFGLSVPKAGAIVSLTFHDLDNEGIGKKIYVANHTLESVTQPADNAAFTYADSVSQRWAGKPLNVSVFETIGSANQLGFTPDLPYWYYAPRGVLWFSIRTLGADNIAAGSLPMLSLIIERYED